MRNSGMDWIGEITEHWEIRRTKSLSNVVRGGSPRPAGDTRYYEGNIPFMKVADITKDDNIYVDSCEYSIKEAGLPHTRLINPGTLLLSNSGATLGIPKINTFTTTFNDGIAAFLNLDERIDIFFAYYSLKARTKHFLESASLGIGQPNLNTDIIGNTRLLIPPLDEQRNIASYLDTKCSEIDSLIALKQAKIEKLKEYKKSVIYEYVTGKKEVC
jgi:type I restriction enzyme S subunit